MALSVEKLLTDAHTLIVRLKSHDSLADGIIGNSQELLNKVEAMKQYQDDITELNEIAKHRPRSTLVLGIAQENRQIRQLQQENRELEASLEEHQTVLELIMQKYREHTVKLLQSNQMERALQEKDVLDKNSKCELMDKIYEMAGVMQKAIGVDETQGCEDKEKFSRLECENRVLREMLEICTTTQEPIIVPNGQKDEDASKANVEEKEDDGDEEDDNTDTESDITVLEVSLKVDEEVKIPPTEKEKKEIKKEPTESKKKTDVGKGEPVAKDTAIGNTGKAAGPSKSTSDIKKGKTSSSSPIKRTTSATTVRKETLKKSPSLEKKKDVKSKTGAKAGIKK